MEIQNAIEILKTHNDKCSGCDKLCNDLCKPAVELAISALEKQTPKKPHITIYRAIDAETKEDLTYHLKHCPCCFDNREVPYFSSLIDTGTTYCRRCGQAIDWSE